jgi:hypothetical protein
MRTNTLLLLLVLLAFGCGGGPDPSGDSSAGGSGGQASRTGHEPTEVIVTSDDASLPDGCHPRQIAEIVMGFIYAFNSGNQEQLARLFFVSEGPSPPDFSTKGYYPWSWYSVSEVGAEGRIEDGFVTYDQSELLSYFAKRHEQSEHLELLKVSVTGAGVLGEEDNVGIIYALTREAEDLGPGLGGPDHVAIGKGAINCASRRIFVWSMEMRAWETRSAREAASWLCTDPPGWRPGKAVVACA